MARNVVIQDQPNTRRVHRRPKHSWQVDHRPWQLQPICIAPVLVGETLTNMNFQIRAVTDPIKNKLVGWWYETYWFYVKVQDLESVPGELTNMFVDPMADMSSFNASAVVNQYHYGTAINWTGRCLNKVVADYFRNEGEAVSVNAIDSQPIVSIGTEGTWLQSYDAATAVEADDVIIPTTAGGGGDDVSAAALERAMFQWSLNKQQNLTKMTFEEYLIQQGMRPAASTMGRSELIRFTREWSYPSNTVEPTTGVPTSAVSWSVSERANKRRMFSQPGFILGVSCCRPKVYRSKQTGSAVGLMNSALRWLPTFLLGDTGSSVIVVDNADAGPLTGQTADYTFDLKDLLLYGDQFVNYDPTTAGKNIVAMPTAGAQARYATATDADTFFTAASPANKIRADGVVQFDIQGWLVDTTP